MRLSTKLDCIGAIGFKGFRVTFWHINKSGRLAPWDGARDNQLIVRFAL
jgi:hypothetical protein